MDTERQVDTVVGAANLEKHMFLGQTHVAGNNMTEKLERWSALQEV